MQSHPHFSSSRFPHCAACSPPWLLANPCRQLLAGNAQQRQMGLSLLVQFSAPLLGGGWPGARQDAAFWELLRACLCDTAASSRKQARHVLKLAVQQPEGAYLPAN